jgi:hypothetical protein
MIKKDKKEFKITKSGTYQVDASCNVSEEELRKAIESAAKQGIPDVIEIPEHLYKDMLSATNTHTYQPVSLEAGAVDPLGIKYTNNKCKYRKKSGVKFKNEYIAHCPHCRAMFKA